MQLSKNGRQTHIPRRKEANIKGTVSGTFVPTPSFSEMRLLRLAGALCQRFVTSSATPKKPSFRPKFFQTPRRNAAIYQSRRNEQTRYAIGA
jgi:hypothetical protein